MQNDKFINDFAEKLQSIGTLHALGDTWISFDSTVPAGGVPFCGQLVSRNLWTDLYAWATAQGKVKTEAEWQAYATAHGGNCPFYSSGDNDTNFRMPKVSAYFKGADSAEDGGKWVAEGLPNITGTTYGDNGGDKYASAFSGAFYLGAEEKLSGVNADSDNALAHFDASRCSPIYGNSEHVTPETCTVLVGVYAVGIISTVGSSDVDKVASAVASLESAVEVRLKKSTPHIVETWKSENGTSWYRKYSDGWIEQGGYLSSLPTAYAVFSLTTAFSSSTYTILLSGINNQAAYTYAVDSRTTTTFQAKAGSSGANAIWFACGF